MLKNPTPFQIAVLSSLIIALSSFLVAWFATWLSHSDFNSLDIGLITAGVFIISYTVIVFFLKKYIYRKIKLIYKTIHQQKLHPEEKQQVIDIRSNIMEDVEKEVEQWAENQEKEIETLKAYEEYRRKFIGDVSHELKTPLFNIQGYVETLLDGAKNDPEKITNYLQRAAKNVERLNTIIEDLEAIARLESGELILDMQAFDIRDLTEDVFEDLEIKAKEKRIKLSFKEGAGAHFKVRADRETIRQVLTNLLYNSIKYGREEGQTKVGFYDMDKVVLIEVADNGIGIAKEHLNHVFDRFYRVDKSRSREQGGSGLGLSIVKHIIEAHKQTINVRSTQGLGSTFGFTLEKA